MTKDDDILKRTQETIEKVERLLEEAEARNRETQELFQSLGINPEKITPFLDRPDIPPELKERIKQEREQFQKEIEEEIAQAMARAKESASSSKVSLGVKKGVIRI